MRRPFFVAFVLVAACARRPAPPVPSAVDAPAVVVAAAPSARAPSAPAPLASAKAPRTIDRGVPAPKRILDEATRILASAKVSRYSHEDDIDEESGRYELDCSGLATYVLRASAPDELDRVPRDPGEARPRAWQFFTAFDQAAVGAQRRSFGARGPKPESGAPTALPTGRRAEPSGDMSARGPKPESGAPTALPTGRRAEPSGDQSPDPLVFDEHQPSGWRKIERLPDARPGDLIAWRKAKIPRKGNTGHVVIVAEPPVREKNGAVRVVVIDSTGVPHAHDTRGKQATGVGRGTMWFVTDARGAPVAYLWGAKNGRPRKVAIAIGRAVDLEPSMAAIARP